MTVREPFGFDVVPARARMDHAPSRPPWPCRSLPRLRMNRTSSTVSEGSDFAVFACHVRMGPTSWPSCGRPLDLRHVADGPFWFIAETPRLVSLAMAPPPRVRGWPWLPLADGDGQVVVPAATQMLRSTTQFLAPGRTAAVLPAATRMCRQRSLSLRDRRTVGVREPRGWSVTGPVSRRTVRHACVDEPAWALKSSAARTSLPRARGWTVVGSERHDRHGVTSTCAWMDRCTRCAAARPTCHSPRARGWTGARTPAAAAKERYSHARVDGPNTQTIAWPAQPVTPTRVDGPKAALRFAVREVDRLTRAWMDR
jgi:hypothetical protein